MTPRLVALDSVVFRHEKPERLRALVDAGFKLRVSAVALTETWASALARNEVDILASAAQRLRRLTDEAVPIEPTLDTYILERGGVLPKHVAPTTAAEHHAAYARAWEIVTTSPLTRDALKQGEHIVEDVRNQRERWLTFCDPWREDWFEGWIARQATKRGQRPPTRLNRAAKMLMKCMRRQARDPARFEHFVGIVHGQFEGVLLKLGMTQDWIDGTHALGRMMAWQAIHGGARIARPANHDAGDAHQLAHLAVGTIATSDKTFIGKVAACGTHQAPWVCTVDQLLTAPPEGAPIGPDVHERSKRSAAIAARVASK